MVRSTEEWHVPGENIPLPVPLAFASFGFVTLLSGALDLGELSKTVALEVPPAPVLTTPDAAAPAPTPVAEAPPLDAGAAPVIEAVVAADPCPARISFYYPKGGTVPILEPTREIDALVAWLNDHPAARLRVEGHADPLGGEESNLVLSHRRARAVAKLFEARAIPSTRLVALALGATQDSGTTKDGVNKDRRVDVAVEPESARCVPETRSTSDEH